MERKIGTTFTYKGLELKVKEAESFCCCKGCIFDVGTEKECATDDMIIGLCSRIGRSDDKDVIFVLDESSDNEQQADEGLRGGNCQCSEQTCELSQMNELNIVARKAVVEPEEDHVHVSLELDCNDRLRILDDFKVDDIVKHIGVSNLLNGIDRQSIENHLKQNYHDEC